MLVCDNCGRAFRTAQALGSHRRYAHPAVSAGPSRAPVLPASKSSSEPVGSGAVTATSKPQPELERKLPAWVWIAIITVAGLILPLALAALEGFPEPVQVAGGQHGV
jgi:hypothetical protein